ncbi:armadillo-type protein [Lipomyces arxii]|uniref:armadillo-type protein n=1 Tax=Lipomyces arxii TaxID=56418 RepID=UPI0034CD2FF2
MSSTSEYEFVVQKVKTFYDIGNSEHIAQIQRELQVLQKSSEGWKLADALLADLDPNVRFFGALTYTVKLNQDWPSLTSSDISILLNRLTNWFLTYRYGPRFIVQKIAATLLLVLNRRPSDASSVWPYPVYDVIVSLAQNAPVVGSVDLMNEISFRATIQSLSQEDLEVALLFCKTFSEEIADADVARESRPLLYKMISAATEHMLCLISPVIQKSSGEYGNASHTLLISTITTFRAWTMSCVSCESSSQAVQALTALIPNLVMFLELDSDIELFGAVIEALCDFMEWADKLIAPDTLLILLDVFAGGWSAAKIQRLVTASDEDEGDEILELFLNGFVAFGGLVAKDLASTLTEPRSRRVIKLMIDLLRTPGYPVEDESVSKRTLEFWELLVDSVLYDDNGHLLAPRMEPHQKLQEAKDIMMQVMELLWVKLRVPPVEIVMSWSQDSRDSFFAFRKDVADLIERSYQLVQPQLFSILVQYVIQSITASPVDWAGVEASLYALNSILQNLTSEPKEFEYLKTLLDSPLFALLPESPLLRARQTSVSLIASSVPYFQSEAGTAYVPVVLPYLFHCLNSPPLSLHASRSIYQICSNCPAGLSAELPAFINIYRDIIENGTSIDGVAKERVAGAVAAVINQTVDKLFDRTMYLSQLIDCVGIYAEQASRIPQDPDRFIEARERAASVLKALSMIGKESRDVEEVEDKTLEDHELIMAARLKQWDLDNAPGRPAKSKILNTVLFLSHNVDIFRGDLAIRQNACSVFKAGLSEVMPGPFTFGGKAVIKFVAFEILQVRRLDTIQPVLALGCSLIASSAMSATNAEAHDVCQELLELLNNGVLVPSHAADPDINEAVLEVLLKYITKQLSSLISSPHCASLINFAIATISASESLVVKAAMRFWMELLSCYASDGNPELSHAVRQLVELTGPEIFVRITAAITGKAPRSLVAEYARLLKAYLRNGVMKSQNWLESALQGTTVSAQQAEDRRKFVLKIMRLRGKPPTDTIVKDFWLHESGLEVDYVA